MLVKIGMDTRRYYEKETAKREMGNISNRVVGNIVTKDIVELADEIGSSGYAFAPAIFSQAKRKKENFVETQLFVLDFDSGVPYQKIRERAQRYNIGICFAYYTLGSTEAREKFRVVFSHVVPVDNLHIAEMMIAMLLTLFEEADKVCKDVTRMFLGGKKLIEMNQDVFFTIEDLTILFQMKLKKDRMNNYFRDLTNFARKYRIAIINNNLAIGRTDAINENEDFMASAANVYIGDATNSSFCYRIITGYQKVKRSKEKDYRLTNLNAFDNICQLLSDFQEGIDIGHSERFRIMTNLRLIRGGKKLFLEIISNKWHNYDKWKMQLSYISDQGYNPQSCEGCIYCDQCKHEENIIGTLRKNQDNGVKLIGSESEYVTVEKAYECLNNNIEEAINREWQGLTLITAQTAMGKTRAYCEIIKKYQHSKKFIIAVPTNILKDEIASALWRLGVDFIVSPSLDNKFIPKEVAYEVKAAYERGVVDLCGQALRWYIKENKDDVSKSRYVQGCNDFLEFFDKVGAAQVILTTHARLLTFQEAWLQGRIVLIDEDILLLQIFKKIIAVDINDIETAYRYENTPTELRNKLQAVIDSQDDNYYTLKPDIYARRMSLEEMDECGLAWNANINELLLAATYVKSKDGKVSYFCPQTLCRGVYIILSATINENIYRKYFSGHRIYSMQEKKAKYKGKLIQYTNYSLGRANLEDKIETILNKVKEDMGKEVPVITFKKYQDTVISSGLHFGNTAGINCLKGKDIAIIGTPFMAEEGYKLTAFYLGADVNEEGRPHRERTEYGRYSFLMTTYNEPLLREVQLYSISSELEQSIGRARLLRCDCTVYLFSAFPCEQAELMQEDYLYVEDELCSC